METVEHHIQDAAELLAVAEMQFYAEQSGLSRGNRSKKMYREYENYLSERNVSARDLRKFPEYIDNIKIHIPTFINRFRNVKSTTDLHFHCNEKDQRNLGKKGDFAIEIDGNNRYSVSLKNYRKSIARPQVQAGTFNSFVLSFLFESAEGVGKFKDPRNGETFHGATKARRDACLRETNRSSFIPLLGKLDTLNSEIKETFVNSPKFEFLDESVFDKARKRVGNKGAELALEILEAIPINNIRKQMVQRIGFDGVEDQLMFDPIRYTDSITVPTFSNLIRSVREDADFQFGLNGQGISFEFSNKNKNILSIQVPFTINKNGAWISEKYTGKRFHEKEGKMLATGQRRPKKSRELATSVNTYLDLNSAGIFI